MSRPFLGKGGVRNDRATAPAPAKRGRGRGTPVSVSEELESHIQTIGVKRPGFGGIGRAIEIKSNFFTTTIPDKTIYHYDVITPSEQSLPARFNMLLIRELQSYAAPDIFTPPAAYDGRKNIFAIRKLPFGDTDTREFNVSYPRDTKGETKSTAFKIKLTKVAEINPEILRRFIEGKQSYDTAATTAITAMNVVVRMSPSMQYPYNVRSFFVDQGRNEQHDLGRGLLLWQGYFQSIRPTRDRMMINIDIAAGVVYEDGPLIHLCLNHLGKRGQFDALVPGRRFQESDRLKLQRFASGLKITSQSNATAAKVGPRVLRKFTSLGANQLQFSCKGQTKTVAEYFNELLGRPLQYPGMICAEVGHGTLIPLELCNVIRGQLARRQVPSDCTAKMIKFASKLPDDRIRIIEDGIKFMGYATSDYVRHFGLSTNPQGPIALKARILEAPALKYIDADRSRRSFRPQNGAWNMDKKKFYKPVLKIFPWALFILELRSKFRAADATACSTVMVHILRDLGINVPRLQPSVIEWGNQQGNIIEQLQAVADTVRGRTKDFPQLIIVILPKNGSELYTAVKHFGDVHMGIVTQCMVSEKCLLPEPERYNPNIAKPQIPSAKLQYYSNVALKINVKLGGVNMVLDADALNDPAKPTIIMGADVIHPAPGANGRPSYTALVGNIDSEMAKFVAATRVQASRLEIVSDLKEMAVDILKKWKANRREGELARKNVDYRLIFYRDGISEGQFKQVLDIELAALKAALEEVKVPAKITFIVVGKRHHVRFFPRNHTDRDQRGNCLPGTVVDTVGHPIEFDFYLQSHAAGILGTSRPSHYSVLYDDNKFTPDALQTISYHLCYTYARATRAVSIPAPVYYADIVCSRAKNHYNPYAHVLEQVNESSMDLELFKLGFKPVHKNLESFMYFS